MEYQLRIVASLASRHLRMAGLALLLLATPLLKGNVDRTGNFAERTLAAHNRERNAMGIAPLQWDERLATDAAAWAEHLTRVGYLTHSPDNPYDDDPQGENLWAGTSGHYGLEAMVGLWIAEKRNFKSGVFPDNSRTGNLEDIGHYTQLVWRSTGKVGCALARGRGDEFLVCRYSEGGNVIGERPF
jgi:Cysteine-rich secretory protein family